MMSLRVYKTQVMLPLLVQSRSITKVFTDSNKEEEDDENKDIFHLGNTEERSDSEGSEDEDEDDSVGVHYSLDL